MRVDRPGQLQVLGDAGVDIGRRAGGIPGEQAGIGTRAERRRDQERLLEGGERGQGRFEMGQGISPLRAAGQGPAQAKAGLGRVQMLHCLIAQAHPGAVVFDGSGRIARVQAVAAGRDRGHARLRIAGALEQAQGLLGALRRVERLLRLGMQPGQIEQDLAAARRPAGPAPQVRGGTEMRNAGMQLGAAAVLQDHQPDAPFRLGLVGQLRRRQRLRVRRRRRLSIHGGTLPPLRCAASRSRGVQPSVPRTAPRRAGPGTGTAGASWLGMSGSPAALSRFATGLIAILVVGVVAGCQRSAEPPAAAAATPVAPPAIAHAILAVSQTPGGAAQAELAANADDLLQPGTLLRVRSADGQRDKGLIQVTGAARGRILARVAALTDRRDPVGPGDVALAVADPARLAPPRPATAPAIPTTPADPGEARLAALRAELARREADLAQAREHLAELDRLRGDHIRQQAELDRLRLDAERAREDARLLAQALRTQGEHQAALERAASAAEASASASIAASRADAAQARSTSLAAERAKLEAERALLELVAQILRTRPQEGLEPLQQVLRQRHAAGATP